MKWQIIVLLLLVIACAKPAVEKAPESAPEQKTVISEPVAKAEAVGIAAAMQMGKPVKCVSQMNDQTATIYMKGSQMRMDTMPADAHGIYTADAMYTWKDNQGMMMKMDDVKRMSAAGGQPIRPKTQEEIVANAESSNTKCELTSVDESMFTPPADIKFQDMGEMLKQAEAAMKGLKK